MRATTIAEDSGARRPRLASKRGLTLLDLLDAIENSGKLTVAARAARISHRHAWNLIEKWSSFFGAPLVNIERGRGTQLSALGAKLLWAGKRAGARLGPELDNLAAELASSLNDVVADSVRIHASHDFSLAKLRELAGETRSISIDLRYRGSAEALEALRRGVCDVAGFSVTDGPLGQPAAAHYAQVLDGSIHRLIWVAARAQGLMLAKGNPKSIGSVADLGRPGVRFINRQRDSGTRMLLDQLLVQAGIDPARIVGYEREEPTHAAVAAHVASGLADAGLGIKAAAVQFVLDFLPVATEHYFFAVHRDLLARREGKLLIGLLRGDAFHDAIAGLHGAGTHRTGDVSPIDRTPPWDHCYSFSWKRPPRSLTHPRRTRNTGESMHRRSFIQAGAAASLVGALPRFARAQQLPFDPKPAGWRTFEISTRVEILKPEGVSRAWVPVPSVQSDYQKVADNTWSGNGSTRLERDGKYGAAMVMSEWSASDKAPVLEVVSTFSTINRATDFGKRNPAIKIDPATAKFATAPTELIPTDGIVRKTAYEITRGKSSDMDKARAIYEWIVDNTQRNPKTRGCGVGDIKAMLETGDLSGKCADLNALFVGLARSVNIPARDVYGLRVAKSDFGYRSLGVGSPNATRAQHCRAEVFLVGYGWVPVDPADVRKVVLEEKPQPTTLADPVVPPVRAKLFGAWEMNWVAYNEAHDIKLPGSSGPAVGFLMYPQAETGKDRLDSLDPDNFKYTITARELKA